MELSFGKAKTYEKWGTTSRNVDLRKTVPTFTRTAPEPLLVQQLSPWFCRAMLDAVPDDYRILYLDVADPSEHAPQIDH